ncbi:MAG: Hemagglutinin/hemolysin-like protein, partial [Solirubrobacterales bacterium]|nr:Hemagglutinin/hemolysin-like protein [Solirubrobacterales bacterium]
TTPAPLPGVAGGVLGATWRTQAAFVTYDPTFAFTATALQREQLTKNAVWTLDELGTALDATGSAPVGIGIPNLVGTDVSLVVVGGGVGRSGAPVSITVDRLRAGTLTDEEKGALALATAPGDAILFGTVGGGAERSWELGQQPPDAVITRVVVGRTSPLFVSVRGALRVTASGHVFVQSSATSLLVDRVQAGGEVRLTSPGRLLAVTGVAYANVTTPGDVRLKSGSGDIAGAGAAGSDAPFTIDIDGRLVSAEAGGRLIVRQLGGDLRFDELSAGGHVGLTVEAGGLVQGQSTISGITGTSLTIVVRDAVGTRDDLVQIELDPAGPLTITAPAGVFLRSMGATTVQSIVSSTGNVTLDVRGNALVNRISALLGTVSIFSDGAILDGRSPTSGETRADAQIVATGAVLRASTGIGTAGDFLETSVARLEARSFQSMWIKNFGDLVVGGLDDGMTGVQASGLLTLVLASTLTVDEAIDSGGGAILLQASEGIIVNRDITSGGGTITFRAGTFVTMTDGTTVDAGSGTIDLLAAGDVLVSLVRTTGLAQLVTTAGSILDADTTGALDVVAGRGDLRASGTVGTAANPLETDFSSTAVTGLVGLTGITINEIGDLDLGNATAVTGDVVVVLLDTPAGAPGVLTVTGDVLAITGSILLTVSGALLLATDASLTAADRIVLSVDLVGPADATGATVTVLGALGAQLIDIVTGAQDDRVEFSPRALVGHVRISTGAGEDLVVLDAVPSLDIAHKLVGSGPGALVNGTDAQGRPRDVLGVTLPQRDMVEVDGGAGADTVRILLTATQDVVFLVHDSGTDAGVDRLELVATAAAETFLVRANSITAMATIPGRTATDAYERVGIDASIDAVHLDMGAGDDEAFLDDTPAPLTIDGGLGADGFQVGQLFGTSRDLPRVAVGDPVATVETTRGFLSRGVSFVTTLNGGAGDDDFQIYGNQAPLALNGDADNDTFVVRAFVLSSGANASGGTAVDGGSGDDEIAYAVNALVSIAGGAGADALVVLGSETADRFVVTAVGVTGAGRLVAFDGIERMEVDGLEGDDHFIVLSTRPGTLVTLVGGAGSDRFDVTAELGSPVVIEGGAIAARPITQGRILPTETDVTLVELVVPNDPASDTDTLNVLDTAATVGRTGALGLISADQAAALAVIYGLTPSRTGFGQLSGLGTTGAMSVDFGTSSAPDLRTFAAGISFHEIEVVDVRLGAGDDTFTVAETVLGTITVVQGGGGADALTVLDAGGPTRPVALFGDSSQDGLAYAPAAGSVPVGGLVAGDDTLDARQATGAVSLYGGAGDDLLLGSLFGDWLGGGSGDDVLEGFAGADVLLGDDGFNLDLTRRLSLVEAELAAGGTRQVLLVTSRPSARDDARFSDDLRAGNDTLRGGEGIDVLVGDHGRVDQLPGRNLMHDTGAITSIVSTVEADGGDDELDGGAGDDVMVGGAGADVITDRAGAGVVLGDSGRILLETANGDGLSLSLVETTGATHGGNDRITTGALADLVIGGAGADVIQAGDGTNLVFGDGGRFDFKGILRSHAGPGDDEDPSDLDRAESVSPEVGGGDEITTGFGDDLVIGGAGADVIRAGEGANVLLGDSGEVVGARSDAPFMRYGLLPIVIWQVHSTLDDVAAGPDLIVSGAGDDLVVGGGGGDTVRPGDGSNHVVDGRGDIRYEEANLLAPVREAPVPVPVLAPVPVAWIHANAGVVEMPTVSLPDPKAQRLELQRAGYDSNARKRAATAKAAKQRS